MPVPGEIVTVTVTRVSRSFMLAALQHRQGFVFVHASQVSERTPGNLEDFFKTGQPLRVKLLAYDQKHGR